MDSNLATLAVGDFLLPDMKFEFPKDKKTETLNISIYLSDINKVRSLAKKYNCTINDIYKTLISEALEEYEKQFGAIDGTEPKKVFSVKRDYLEAGDGRRKEVDPNYEHIIDSRTRETKRDNAEEEEENDLPFKELGHKIVDWSALHDKCIKCGTTERRHMGKGLCTTCYYHEKKKETIEKQVVEEPIAYAFCQYLLCPKKKYIRSEGIEADKKNFCTDKCYEAWLESTKDIDRESYYGSPETATLAQ